MRRVSNKLSTWLFPKERIYCNAGSDAEGRSGKTSVTRIALLPVVVPAELGIKDRTLTDAFLTSHGWVSEEYQRKMREFLHALSRVRESIGLQMSEALHTSLCRAGFDVELVENETLAPGRLEVANKREDSSREVSMIVNLTEVNMASSCWGHEYSPQVNAQVGVLAVPPTSRWLADASFYYGADSSGDTPFSIPADATQQYSSLHTMISDAACVPRIFEYALPSIAERAASWMKRMFNRADLLR